VYCLKHEYFALLPGRRAEIESVVKNVRLLDEFLLRSGAISQLRVATKDQSTSDSESRKLIFHPHCHQRAEGLADDGLPAGTSSTVMMLREFGFEVEILDTGCCGMAGTFGYDAEHYELSMRVGELKLFPALHLSKIGNQKLDVLSSGSACRLQIQQGAGMKAKHPLEVIADLIR